MLNLLSSYTAASSDVARQVTRQADTVELLFRRVWDDWSSQAAIDLIVQLMSVPAKTGAAGEQDRASKTELFAKYVETLPRAMEGWAQRGTGLVHALLLGVRQVVRARSAMEQELFRWAATGLPEASRTA